MLLRSIEARTAVLLLLAAPFYGCGARTGLPVPTCKGHRSNRVQIRELQRDERDAFLREDGHPELIPGRRVKAVAA
jgi:hypothetical protein